MRQLVRELYVIKEKIVKYNIFFVFFLVQNGQLPATNQNNPTTAHNSGNQCGFMFRGVYLSLVTNFAPGVAKAV